MIIVVEYPRGPGSETAAVIPVRRPSAAVEHSVSLSEEGARRLMDFAATPQPIPYRLLALLNRPVFRTLRDTESEIGPVLTDDRGELGPTPGVARGAEVWR